MGMGMECTQMNTERSASYIEMTHNGTRVNDKSQTKTISVDKITTDCVPLNVVVLLGSSVQYTGSIKGHTKFTISLPGCSITSRTGLGKQMQGHTGLGSHWFWDTLVQRSTHFSMNNQIKDTLFQGQFRSRTLVQPGTIQITFLSRNFRFRTKG